MVRCVASRTISLNIFASNCCGMCRRVTNVSKVYWWLRVFRNGIVSQVIRARAGTIVGSSRAGLSRQSQRMVDRRLSVAPLNFVFPLLQHCCLKGAQHIVELLFHIHFKGRGTRFCGVKGGGVSRYSSLAYTYMQYTCCIRW